MPKCLDCHKRRPNKTGICDRCQMKRITRILAKLDEDEESEELSGQTGVGDFL